MKGFLTSVPLLGALVGAFLWFWDYAYAYSRLAIWVLNREILTPHLKLNLRNLPSRKGQVAVITGGTRGIGASVVRKLLLLDLKVIMGCRSLGDGERLLKRLRADGVLSGSLECLPLDLASLESVRSFAAEILSTGTPVHLLINNAGIMAVPFRLTEDGHESHFQVNYLSHFLLINLLLPVLSRTAERAGTFGRIVNVSSSAQYDGKVDFQDVELRRRYNPFMAYFNSKWMQVVMTRFLDARLQAQAVRVRVNSLHPGVVATDLISHVPVLGPALFWFEQQFLMTPDQGGDEVVFVAMAAEAENKGGEYFVQRRVCPLANDTPRLQKHLWELSCKLVGVTNKFS